MLKAKKIFNNYPITPYFPKTPKHKLKDFQPKTPETLKISDSKYLNAPRKKNRRIKRCFMCKGYVNEINRFPCFCSCNVIICDNCGDDWLKNVRCINCKAYFY